MNQRQSTVVMELAIYDEGHAAPIVDHLREARGDADRALRLLKDDLAETEDMFGRSWHRDELEEAGIDVDDEQELADAWSVYRQTYTEQSKDRLQRYGGRDEDIQRGPMRPRENPGRGVRDLADYKNLVEEAWLWDEVSTIPTKLQPYVNAKDSFERRAVLGRILDAAYESLDAKDYDKLERLVNNHNHNANPRAATTDVACPTCKAAPGAPCKTDRGSRYSAHLARGVAADAESQRRVRNPALRRNPGRSAPDLEAAKSKYEEFHRYEHRKVGEFERGFTIPTSVVKIGRAIWVTYESSKVDPSTLKKPSKPVSYIHEHDAGVHLYMTPKHAAQFGRTVDMEFVAGPTVKVPSAIAGAQSLVCLGKNLGYKFALNAYPDDAQEAEAVEPFPELYCTPDGKCLLVIQSKREVLAMMWGGALGVFARGIDG